MAVNKADLSSVESSLEAKLGEIRSALVDIKGLINRNIQQDSKMRSDMDSLSKANTILAKLNEISSSIDAANVSLSQIQSSVASLSGDISALSSRIN
ncbi:MAG: hypothetical protein PHS44_08105 [Candidatus Dojkabacteria bacterium]|nr:hypothetical protein [Candidatus Dojkabacteria bacterium]